MLEVAESEIYVVGSAKTGFSLDPNQFPRPGEKAAHWRVHARTVKRGAKA